MYAFIERIIYQRRHSHQCAPFANERPLTEWVEHFVQMCVPARNTDGDEHTHITRRDIQENVYVIMITIACD